MKSPIILFFLKKKFLSHLSLACLLLTSFSCSNLSLEENLEEITQSSENTASSDVSQASVAESQPSETTASSDSQASDTESQPSETAASSDSQASDTESQPPKRVKKSSSEYVNTLLPEARRIEKEYGIPIDLTIAIAREESGNGDYVIGKNNHFGLRCASDDCITLEKNGQLISYETCPDASECFNIFAGSVKKLTGDKKITLRRRYRNGYATSPQWVGKVRTIRKEVRRTLSKAGIKY